jgi:nicotinate-nucleotide adenylyltransferase
LRTGILGGSFNPVHNQHIQMALAAQKQFELEEVWFIPVFHPVHKPGSILLDYDARRELLQTAINGLAGLRVCDIERALGGASYTVRTVAELQQQYRGREFFLVIGGDSLTELHSWREIARLAEMIEFIVIERPGCRRVSQVPSAKLHWAECEVSAVSASDIRTRLARYEFSGLQLAPGVLFKILLNNYYDSLGEPYSGWLATIFEQLRLLPEGLVGHIMSVAEMAVGYGLEAGLDPKTCLLAGLSHDLFRVADASEQLFYADLCGTQLSTLERKMPMLAHGAAAAGFLRQRIPAIDPDIVNAVRWHTFPADDAPLLTRVLVLADTLEPSRGIAERDILRQAAMPLDDRYQKVIELKRKSARSH